MITMEGLSFRSALNGIEASRVGDYGSTHGKTALFPDVQMILVAC
jgi:hypothetical protein